ncbi:hypothetical protein [Paenibacillus lemnae]|uniref:Uncharacterized protein n=1 Tax=Paenibacillus lemnae TaxID=1330551 RepID=A0A848M5H3_PAELE|nr:hypothetical protein [Paenibacillus lemnae]NMO96378.1 hypothetical protein [Paenibacillus lemnae]
MTAKLNEEEQQYLEEVLSGLKHYHVSRKAREGLKAQLVDHFQDAREQGDHGMDTLESSADFIRNYLEVHKLDLYSENRKMRGRRGGLWKILISGVIIFTASYTLLQLLWSIFLTESLVSGRSLADYSLLYYISPNSWWNAMLMLISICSSLLISAVSVWMLRRRERLVQ